MSTCEPAPRIILKSWPDSVAIASVFGDALDPKTWSGAPNNVATSFERMGISVSSLFARVSKLDKYGLALRHISSGYGIPKNSESLFRDAVGRRHRARKLARLARQQGVKRVLHTGTLDLPACDADEDDHYLSCDQTWDLSLRYRPDLASHTARARSAFDAIERDCYAQMRHIFTFGDYVRDNLIAHYGVEPARVTSVGSGMGQIDPFFGPKVYEAGMLLFVAKHLFAAKGGHLALEAFRQVKAKRPELRVVVVWDGHDPDLPRRYPDVEFMSKLRWGVLTWLYREASLLVQPMLNDPWGQVYLEALVSRTPVLGLNRNALPEITQNGKHGFLVDDADSDAIARTILDAMSDPARLARMGLDGQRYVLRHHSWDRAAKKMAAVMAGI
jgi:glycosyltransferase involved in cell wall biosynthesis